MTDTEPDALWEQALQEQEDAENQLAEEIAWLAMEWADSVDEAVRIISKTQYLGGNQWQLTSTRLT